jgi:hypothetical protein
MKRRLDQILALENMNIIQPYSWADDDLNMLKRR